MRYVLQTLPMTAKGKRYMLRNPDNDKYASNSEENS